MTEEKNDKRVASVLVTGEFFGEIARTGSRIIKVKSPIPESAIFRTAHFDFSKNAWVAMFDDPSFDVVPEGKMIPVLDTSVEITVTEGTE